MKLMACVVLALAALAFAKEEKKHGKRGLQSFGYGFELDQTSLSGFGHQGISLGQVAPPPAVAAAPISLGQALAYGSGGILSAPIVAKTIVNPAFAAHAISGPSYAAQIPTTASVGSIYSYGVQAASANNFAAPIRTIHSYAAPTISQSQSYASPAISAESYALPAIAPPPSQIISAQSYASPAISYAAPIVSSQTYATSAVPIASAPEYVAQAVIPLSPGNDLSYGHFNGLSYGYH